MLMPETPITWAVRNPRPWISAYRWSDDERIAGLIRGLREAVGCETAQEFSGRLYRLSREEDPSWPSDLPAVLIEAIEFPAINWMDYIAELAEGFQVSPGTLLDHLLLRGAGVLDEDGTEDES